MNIAKLRGIIEYNKGVVYMRRKIFAIITIIICLVTLIPLSAYAETYQLGGTDMSIRVDDSYWYVFTRDNIKNNSELDELGIPYNKMYDILHDNEAYMDAFFLYEDGEFVEFFVRKRKLDADIVNLSNYKNSEVLKLAKELANKQGGDTYFVYENQYKFAKIEYIDSKLGYYLCEFFTCINGDNYTFTFQSSSQFTDWEYEEINGIIDSIRFDIDSSLKEPKTTSFWDGVIEKAIGGAILGGIASMIGIIVNKRKKKTNQSDVNYFSGNADL